MEQEKILKETEHYKLVIGKSTGTTSLPCYQIINKEYEMVEQEYFILPQALVNVDQLESLLTKYYLKEKEETAALFKDPNIISIIGKKDV